MDDVEGRDDASAGAVGSHDRVARRSGRRRRWVRALGIVVALLVGAWAVVTYVTPWPSVVVIRVLFDEGGSATAKEMRRFAPTPGVRARLDVEYGHDGGATTLDAFSPVHGTAPLPTVVWIHGGAWISGSKGNVDPYLRILTERGYTTIGLNYSTAPERQYPTAVVQVNEALDYLKAHAAELRVDPDRIVLAGDSAGAQLASQIAAMTTDPRFATTVGIRPALTPSELRGVILNCGIYDLSTVGELGFFVAWGLKVSLWAYSGSRDWATTAAGTQMPTIRHLTAAFPPTYISGGNGDGLTPLQSIPFAARLKALGVPVTPLFWPPDHKPALPHEYQFQLEKYRDADQALAATIAFLAGLKGFQDS